MLGNFARRKAPKWLLCQCWWPLVSNTRFHVYALRYLIPREESDAISSPGCLQSLLWDCYRLLLWLGELFRVMFRHAFINCSPASFLIQFLESMAIRVFGFKIKITLEHTIWTTYHLRSSKYIRREPENLVCNTKFLPNNNLQFVLSVLSCLKWRLHFASI